MRENFTGYEFIIIIGTLFIALTAVHSVSKFTRKLSFKRMLKHHPLTANNKSRQDSPSRIKVLTIQKAEKEQELV